MNLFYVMIPIMISLSWRTAPAYFICMIGFALFQASSWPILLSLVHAYFLPKRDGCMLGFWSAGGDIGNILGFASCTIILYALNLPYQYCLFLPVICSTIFTLLIFTLKLDTKQITAL